MKDPHTQESRGFGFVKMVTAEQADAAKEGLQGENIEGRTLSIEKARRARPRTPTPGKYFGPPKRGETPPSPSPAHQIAITESEKRTSEARLAGGALIDTRIVEVAVTVGTVVAVMMITIVALAMTIVNAALMVAATTTDLVVLIVMPQVAVMTVIAAVVMIAGVAAAAAIMAVTVDVPVTEAMATWLLQEMLAIRTEVELSMIAKTIGTLVVELRLANLLRCGALCQIKAPTPASISRN